MWFDKGRPMVETDGKGVVWTGDVMVRVGLWRPRMNGGVVWVGLWHPSMDGGAV